MDIANPVSRRIDSVSFSFYTADEIRKLSVKQITNSVIFDALNNPTKGGLYDNAMGPTDRNGV
jgi:DNA-directed RNA polymerase I subunit RPA1